MPTRSWRALLLTTSAVFLSASGLLAQSKRPEELKAGKFLVVPRESPDPNFAESVVLLVHYGDDGAVGLMLNRPTKLTASRVLPDIKGLAKYSGPVYIGGPVTMEMVMALLKSHTQPYDATRVSGELYLISTKPELENALVAGAGANELRIYVGYCGWAGGQLENEVMRGGWYIFDGNERLVFDPAPATLWSRLIARTDLHIAQLKMPHLLW